MHAMSELYFCISNTSFTVFKDLNNYLDVRIFSLVVNQFKCDWMKLTNLWKYLIEFLCDVVLSQMI